jgi:hypothetical protein
MMDEDSFQYALENTRIIHAPERRIQTFGSTVFRFFLITELMDSVDRIRVRDGRLHADRPQIITPGNIGQAMLEDFGDKAEEFLESLKDGPIQWAVMKYGFQFRKTDLQETLVDNRMEEVLARVRTQVEQSSDPLCTIIQGVDEGWEVSLLKFAVDMIQSSSPDNLGDFRRRGLL